MTSQNFTLAYFLRAVVRAKQIEYQLSAESVQSIDFQQVRSKNSKDFSLSGLPAVGNESLKMEYEMVLRDYEKVIESAPRFIYVYYNRGNLRCSQQDYRGAIAYLKQGDTVKGTADLSKAGELGVVAAYNLLKRMSD